MTKTTIESSDVQTYADRISQQLRGCFRPRDIKNVWQWAEKNLTLSARVTPHPGPYRTSWCPYVREPQEAFTDPSVQTIVLCWASRSSKTETMLNCIRYSIAEDPQAIIMVQPTDTLARSFIETRFQPSIDDCPILAAEKPENSDQYKLSEMHFKRCTAWCVGSNSPASLKGRGATVLFGDEIDTWPEGTTKETGALQQVLERTKDRWNRKHLLTSTPTVENGQIWREFMLGDRRYYFVPCPHCGEFQTLKMGQLRWSEEAKVGDTWNLKHVKDTTFYECEKCKGQINDSHKSSMNAKGQWRATVSTAEDGRRSYHLNSLYPEWITFSEVATMFLQSKSNPLDLQRFINSWLAEPFYAYGDTAEQEAQLLANRDAKASEGIPEGFKPIMTVDVQQDRVYMVVRAHNKLGESILIEYGCLPGLEECQIAAKKWGVFCVMVDSKYRQQLIFEWCVMHPGWIPTQGAAGLYSEIRWATVPIDGGLLKGRNVKKLNFRPDDFREALNSRIKGKSPSWKLLPEVSEDYKKQMLGEVRVERKGSRGRTVVEWVKRGANHYWDCEVMQVMGFGAVKIFMFDLPKEKDHKPPQLREEEKERLEMIGSQTDENWSGGHELPW